MTNVLNGQAAETEDDYRRRAELGDADAAYNLGVLLEGRRESSEAAKWYWRAARAGDVDAMYNLGGVLQDLGKVAEAERWYRRASDAGDADAKANLDALSRRHTPAPGNGTPTGPVVASEPPAATDAQTQAEVPPPPMPAPAESGQVAPGAWQVPGKVQAANGQATTAGSSRAPGNQWTVPQSRRRRRWPIVLAIAVPLAVVITVIAVVVVSAGTAVYQVDRSMTTNPPLATNQPGPAAAASGITLNQFNQVSAGMSYTQVSQMLRSPGTVLSDSNVAGYHDQIFTWNGTTPGANANVTFENGTVFAKAQFGLTG